MFATCLTLPLILAQSNPPGTVQLKPGSACSTIVITARPNRLITVDAGGSRVSGVVFRNARNIRWKSGTVTAPGGAMALGPSGYAFNLDGSSSINITGVRITEANRGVAGGGGSNISIIGNEFDGMGADAMILATIDGLEVSRNRVWHTIGNQTTCATRIGAIRGLSKAACDAVFGKWTDGFHADAIQLRSGIRNFRIMGNDIWGRTQGITQMEGAGDTPLVDGLIQGNLVITENNHPITFGDCRGCTIVKNKVDRPAGIVKRAVIIAGKALECDNVVQRIWSKPCPATLTVDQRTN